jgi:DNA polymerase III gamma/tau subunit
VQSFERILQGEHIAFETDALEQVAKLSEGSFRDGAKILEEITVGLEGKKLTKDVVHRTFHTQKIEQHITAFLLACTEKDAKKALAIIQAITTEGIDIKYFIQQVLLSLHGALLQQVGLENENVSVSMDLAMIRELVPLFSQAYEQMRFAVLPQLPLELAVVTFSGMQGSDIHQVAPIEKKPKSSEPAEIKKYTSVQSSEDDTTFLHQLLDRLKSENFMLAGVLRSCKIHQEADTLLIEALSTFHKEKLGEKKAITLLEKIAEETSGRRLTVQIVLK